MSKRKQLCLRGHNIAEVGRTSNYECRQCRRDRALSYKARNYNKVREAWLLDSHTRIIADLMSALTREEQKLIEQLVPKLLAWKLGKWAERQNESCAQTKAGN